MNTKNITNAIHNALAALEAAKAGAGPLTVVPAPGGVMVTGTRSARVPVRALTGEDAAALAALLGIASQADSTTLQDAHEINRLRSALAQAEGRALAMTPPGNAVEMERLRAELAQSDATAQARMRDLFAAKEEAAAARAEAEAMAEAMAQGEASQILIKRAEKAEAQLAESIAEARALGRSLDKIRAERSQMDDIETQKTIAQLRAQVAALTVANIAPQVSEPVSITFEPGAQNRTLARAGVTLDDVRACFQWKFANRADPSQGGKWISRPGKDAEALALAEKIFDDTPKHRPGQGDRIDSE